ncbi:MAG: tetratricopeptide repeat protein [Phycisphaerae bacterium]|nr:tetratricopeptide repeat protein [Phycisphaerae bacterium]
MRSDHRHELKTNELADWIANFPEWAHENRTSLVAAAAVILVALLVYFVSFYRKNVVSVGNQTRLTTLVTEVPQQMTRIASATMQGQDESYILVQTEQDLQDFAQKSSDNDMAALALIQRGAAARAELHYRLSEISQDELVKQIAKAQTSYQQALDRKPTLPSLAAAAQYGLGLCEEELGSFDKAAEIYREVAQKPDYTGTTAQAAAAYRLRIMPDYKTAVAFQPAPPKPVPPPVPPIQVQPGSASAPTVTPTPQAAPAAPAATVAPQTPAPAPSKSDTNAPKSN